jgi:hypothetical protein
LIFFACLRGMRVLGQDDLALLGHLLPSFLRKIVVVMLG